MKIFRYTMIGLLLGLAMARMASGQPDDWPQVDGVLGLQTDDGRGWMAIKVDFDAAHALAGVLWYNNDGTVVFPEVSVGTGFEDGPEGIATFVEVAASVSGVSDEWSECEFSEPVAASEQGLYVAFEFPEGAGFVDRGIGGGPAIGFGEGLTDPRGWISGDGEVWYPMSDRYGLAVLPVLVPFEPGMLTKNLGDGAETPDIPEDYYSSVGPNPFNPQVAVRFGLPVRSHARIDVFDVRGMRIRRLLDRDLLAGHHEVIWRGRDGAGRKIASGAYFVRITAGDLDVVRRVTLVK